MRLPWNKSPRCQLPAEESYRAPLKIHFGGQANLFDSGRRQAKATLVSTKADLPSLLERKNLLLAAQEQLLELPLSFLLNNLN
jgi:hypothetical protein